MAKPKIVRQKSLFDDENSDLIYFKEEMKKRREKEIREKEKAYLERKTKEQQLSLADINKLVEQSMKHYDEMIIKDFGSKEVFNDWCKNLFN